MQVLQLSDTLMVDSRHKVILIELVLVAVHLMEFDALESLVLIEGRLEEVPLFDESKSVNIIQEASEQPIQILLLLGEKSLVKDAP